MADAEPAPQRTCALCPRLVEFRAENSRSLPDYFNAPVPSFGSLEARLLIVGLAPGLHGANKTGRPFTGDYAGDLLYATLEKLGLACGEYGRRDDDGFELLGVRVTNAVRCVPPQNKPTPSEIRTCNDFLRAEIASMPALKSILGLGRIAHDGVLSALAARKKDHPFAHGAQTRIGNIELVSSYHCSRYNTNTGVLTPAMFEAAVLLARKASGLE
jgi:uracil-DNA glycosylase family 4